MERISQKERNYLIKECGVPCGEDGVSRSLRNTYYLCMNPTNSKFLNDYRNGKIVKTYSK